MCLGLFATMLFYEVIHMDMKQLYSKAASKLKRSEIGELKSRAAGKPDILSLAEGVPAAELFPTEEIAKAAYKIISEDGARILQYGDCRGDKGLRTHIAHIMEKYAIHVQPDQVQITSGSMQSLDLCARLFLEEGDTVLVEDPTFIDAMNILAFAGGTIEGVPLDEEGMDLAVLEEKLRTNPRIELIYIIPDYQNPTGLTWSQARRKAFMELVAQYDVVVLEDNPYGELTYGEAYQQAVKSYDTKNQVIFMGSLSKTFSPGIRIGWLAGEQSVIDALELVKEHCDLHSSIPDHSIAATYMNIYSYDDHVKYMCGVYKKRRDVFVEALRTYLPDFTFTVPKGGFFLWLRMPAGVDCMKFFDACLEEQVTCVPGTPFYTNKDNHEFMRLNFTGLNEEDLVRAVQRMAKAYAQLV